MTPKQAKKIEKVDAKNGYVAFGKDDCIYLVLDGWAHRYTATGLNDDGVRQIAIDIVVLINVAGDDVGETMMREIIAEDNGDDGSYAMLQAGEIPTRKKRSMQQVADWIKSEIGNYDAYLSGIFDTPEKLLQRQLLKQYRNFGGN